MQTFCFKFKFWNGYHSENLFSYCTIALIVCLTCQVLSGDGFCNYEIIKKNLIILFHGFTSNFKKISRVSMVCHFIFLFLSLVFQFYYIIFKTLLIIAYQSKKKYEKLIFTTCHVVIWLKQIITRHFSKVARLCNTINTPGIMQINISLHQRWA